ncbi:tryptophan synthase subunit alpha [Brevibacillus sp. B_LB10_24]|uniref:tryptophan synthase subunit alpha n=1 Tax=Brevibacillus sp. B_LB10_24 TaxID=3380645 RepID=UPI0038BDE763
MSSLADEIAAKRGQKRILLMTHQILGYPDFETNYEMIRLFAECGVDLVELQLPFSEPIADGPVFLKANQEALNRGTTVEKCLDFARRVTEEFQLPFIFMTYYNILVQYGVERFVETAQSIGIRGLIVPDAYPEESPEYLAACKKFGVDPILLATPYTPEERLQYLSNETGGLLYCVARKGVTGAKTEFDQATTDFLSRCRRRAATPIGVGFGIQRSEDVEYLVGKSDVAIIGSQLLKLLEAEGLAGVRKFLLEVKAVTEGR